MKSTLEELYYASEGLADKIGKSKEFNKIHYKYGKVYEQLFEELNDEQKNMLDELYFLMGGLEAETGLTHFKEGFKFCMRLVFEGIGK